MNCIYQIHFQERNTPYSLDLFVMDYSEKLDRHLIERTREIHQQMSERAREVCGKLHGSKPLRERHTDPAYLEVFQQHHTIIAPEYGSEKNYVVWGIDNVPSWTGMNTFFPCEWVYPLGEVELAGHRFSAPREPEKVVTRIYGEPWSVPDDMFSHRHFNIDETRERILDGILEKYRDWLGDLWDSETL